MVKQSNPQTRKQKLDFISANISKYGGVYFSLQCVSDCNLWFEKMVWTLKVHSFFLLQMCKMKLIGGVHYVYIILYYFKHFWSQTLWSRTFVCRQHPFLSIAKSTAPSLTRQIVVQCHIFSALLLISSGGVKCLSECVCVLTAHPTQWVCVCVCFCCLCLCQAYYSM